MPRLQPWNPKPGWFVVVVFAFLFLPPPAPPPAIFTEQIHCLTPLCFLLWALTELRSFFSMYVWHVWVCMHVERRGLPQWQSLRRSLVHSLLPAPPAHHLLGVLFSVMHLTLGEFGLKMCTTPIWLYPNPEKPELRSWHLTRNCFTYRATIPSHLHTSSLGPWERPHSCSLWWGSPPPPLAQARSAATAVCRQLRNSLTLNKSETGAFPNWGS